MILGFAHITKNASTVGPDNKGLIAVPNALEKWSLMQRRAEWHYIRFDKDREETVEYDTGAVDAPGRLGVSGTAIITYNRNVEAEVGFFCNGLGFKDSAFAWIDLSSPVEAWSVRLYPLSVPDAPIDPPLDINGYAALAFYSSNGEADRDKAIAAGGRTPTEPFTIKLDREMKIIMLRSPEGTIIELIEVRP
jgi:hypothetical protein